MVQCKYCKRNIAFLRLSTGGQRVCVDDVPLPMVIGVGHQHGFDANGNRKLGTVLNDAWSIARANLAGQQVTRVYVEHYDSPEKIAKYEADKRSKPPRRRDAKKSRQSKAFVRS